MKPPAPETENSPLPADRQSNGSKSELPNYDEVCERAASFNSKLLRERKTRLPFIDSHTGIAQKNCHLWFRPAERLPSTHPHHICTYPQRRWRKRRRVSTLVNGFAENGEFSHGSDRKDDQDNAVVIKPTFEKWYDELELMHEELGEDDRISDVSDYEAEMKGKRNRKKIGGGRGRKKKDKDRDRDDDEKDKPFACELCGARYKTRPGLTYHYNHFHSGEPEPEPEPKQPEKPQVQDFCDFCLGDASENKKTKKPEQLFSCSVCGHSGHPSCLQFTQNMIISVKKYPWQCIECKSCGLCGTSDNDDQLLFCDDCDRGYHMYCLRPALTEPPEGSWSCQLCIEEFHGGKDPSKPSTSSSS